MTHSMLVDDGPRATAAASIDARAGAPTTFRNVLVGVDGTSGGRDAIALAETLCDADCRLTLAHVVLVPSAVYGNFHSTRAGKAAREMLKREGAKLGVSAEFTGMFAPSVASGLHQLAADTGADLVVIGSCARGPIARPLRGDATRGTLGGPACAVAVAPRGYAGRPRPIETIGVAYNGSPESETALHAARALAAHHGAALRALTAVWPTSAMVSPAGRLPLVGSWWAIMLEAQEQEACERMHALTDVDGHVVVGAARGELVAFGAQVDLLVVGSRAHGPLRRLLLGSTSASLARTTRSPLLVVPDPGVPQQSHGRHLGNGLRDRGPVRMGVDAHARDPWLAAG
jgi:nucleotide-binding universal stress UspA family protein